jgi:hypothetical protein
MLRLFSTLFTTLLLFCACEPINRYLSLPDDNIFEETTEFVIKVETGADIDLTPSSPE